MLENYHYKYYVTIASSTCFSFDLSGVGDTCASVTDCQFIPHSECIGSPTVCSCETGYSGTSCTANGKHYDNTPMQYAAIFHGCIRITCLCVLYPRTPNFYIVKMGFTGVYIIFLFLL